MFLPEDAWLDVADDHDLSDRSSCSHDDRNFGVMVVVDHSQSCTED